MADHKHCKYYSDCDYRIGVGACPKECVQFKHKAMVVYCADCRNRGNESQCPLLSLADYTEDDDYCSFGDRKTT